MSPGLRRSLLLLAMRRAFDLYFGFIGDRDHGLDLERLVEEYEEHYHQAISLGLFAPGGIREKDHLNLWCIGRAVSPDVYVESGVFIGSSMHALVSSPGVKKILGIDPDLSALRVPMDIMPEAELISDRDFSQVEIDLTGLTALVYFDDHIDTALRISQASEMGFKYLLIDDSTGIQGICQRLYPAVPTVPMIMNADILNPGDELSWTFAGTPNGGIKHAIKRAVEGIITGRSPIGTRVSLIVSEEMIERCRAARGLVKKYTVIADLSEFIPQEYPEKTVDTSKYLVELI